TYRVRARAEEEAERLRNDALLLQEAGCFGLVLEKIPTGLATEVTTSLSIPTIGIGAGAACSGQVLVTHDMLGLTKDFNPRFVRRYANLADTVTDAVQAYITDVQAGAFPSEAESYS
ncbi:MAG: 3-methyl-2-oxobutanoate hydroxymethyltransferase, partial [Bacteroidota bacterium]